MTLNSCALASSIFKRNSSDAPRTAYHSPVFVSSDNAVNGRLFKLGIVVDDGRVSVVIGWMLAFYLTMNRLDEGIPLGSQQAYTIASNHPPVDPIPFTIASAWLTVPL